MIKRKTNRRDMIGDHDGRTARRATLLVRAVDTCGSNSGVRPRTGGVRIDPGQVCLEAGLLLPAGSLAVRCSSGARPRPALPAARRRARRGGNVGASGYRPVMKRAEECDSGVGDHVRVRTERGTR